MVDRDTPSRSAAISADNPETRRSCSIGRRTCGRPSRFPSRLARCNPASTRSRIRSRSNSAMAPRMCICSLPAGVVASMPSARLTNAMLGSVTADDHEKRFKATATALARLCPRSEPRRYAPRCSRSAYTSVTQLAEHPGAPLQSTRRCVQVPAACLPDPTCSRAWADSERQDCELLFVPCLDDHRLQQKSAIA
jgi:hypothetical protein